MFLDQKKGDIVAQFVVLIVIAVILIFVVTSFGARVWSSFFPDDDESTLKSFETLFSVLEAKSVSPQTYDSTILNIYLKKDHNIALFTNGKADCRETHWYGPTVTIYNAPSFCEAGKQCLCLYDDMPDRKTGKQDKHVVKCYSITNVMRIDKEYFYLNDRVCGDQEVYTSYIIAKRTVGTSNYIYVLPDTSENRELDKNWNIPMCNTPNDRSSICWGKSDGSIVEFSDDAHMELLYDYCKTQQNIISTSARCTYYTGTTGADDRGCRIDCSYGDIAKENLNSCESLNKARSITTYLSKEKNYKYYYICDNSDKYNLKCDVSQWDAYICKNSIDGSENSKCQPPSGCDLEYIDPTELKGIGQFITYYDTTNTECKTYMDNNYYPKKSTIMACKSDIVGCENFVTTKNIDCSLKFIRSSSGIYWITYYDPIPAGCDTQVKNLFEIAYICTDTVATP